MIKISELTKEYYRPGELAEMTGRSVRTIQNYCIDGRIKCKITEKGRRMIARDEMIRHLRKCKMISMEEERMDIAYARVSTSVQKKRGDLDRQAEYIIKEIVTKNPKNLKIFKEVGSGMNDERRELSKVLNLVMEKKVDRIFILYKDRLTRFAFHYIEQMCKKFGTRIEVISNEMETKSEQDELAEDIISIIHSFGGKLYGMRNRFREAIDSSIKEVKQDEEEHENKISEADNIQKERSWVQWNGWAMLQVKEPL